MSNTQSSLQQFSSQLAALTTRAHEVTVQITAARQRPTTGTIVRPDLVVAVNHVVDVDQLAVHTHDGRTVDATIVGRDRTRDLVLLRAPGLKGEPLPTASNAPNLGELVVNTSRTWNGHPAVSFGVASAQPGPVRFGRSGRLDRVILSSIAATRGISGSPLVTSAGELAGVVNAGLRRGTPLAIPIREVEQSVEALVTHGRVRRPYLGVGLQPVRLLERQDVQHRHGLVIVGIEPDSPADRAGLLIGDVIVTAGGVATTHIDHLRDQLLGDRVDTSLSLEVVRGGTLVPINVVIGEPPE